MRPQDHFRVLFVCTANQCRSPIAERLFQAAAASRGADVDVSSAGLGRPGVEAHHGAVRAIARLGLDLTAHRSRRLSGELLQAADLVVVMERRHLLAVVDQEPSAWPRSHPLKDLVHRARRLGPRRAEQDLQSWIEALHRGRESAHVLRLPLEVDVTDPTGGPRHGYDVTVAQLAGLLTELAELAFPACAGVPAAPAAPPDIRPAARMRRAWSRMISL